MTSYDAWGVPETPLLGSFGFTGELQRGSDVWLRARWYGAGRGSFGGRDAWAGDAQMPYSLMPYQYAYSAPTLWTDASGEKPCAQPGMSVGQCMDGGGPIVYPPLPSSQSSAALRALAEGLKEGLTHGLVEELVCQVQEGLDALTAPSTHPEPDESRPIVVELGYGFRLDNLITLADAYPTAKVYGIDNQYHGDQSLLDREGYGGRIELLKGDYTSYPTLRQKADVVVGVAPNTNAMIAEGIEHITKPGGAVEILFAQIDSDNYQRLVKKYGSKVSTTGKRASPAKNAPSNPLTLEGLAVDTALGVPLRSDHFHIGAMPWELYIPSW